MGEQKPEKTKKHICAGLLAHVDAGKTTITEQLLLLGGNIRSAGSVDQGTAQTDWMDVERRRGISVKNACAEVPLKTALSKSSIHRDMWILRRRSRGRCRRWTGLCW